MRGRPELLVVGLLMGLVGVMLAAPAVALGQGGRDEPPGRVLDVPAAVAPLAPAPDPEPRPQPAVELPAEPVRTTLPEPVREAIHRVRTAAAPYAPMLAPAEEAGFVAVDPRHGDAPRAATKDFDGASLAPQAPQPVDQAMAAAGVLALGAGLAALFWPALKVVLAPLYSRISKDAVLAHASRENIYRLVRENPGIHAHEVAERLDMAWGTAIHHLKILEQSGLITAYRDGRYKRFFVVGDQRIQQKEAVALLRNDTARRIVEAVSARPGLIQKDVCDALGVSSSLATWHLQRLAEAGLVIAQRRGRVVHYEPGPAWRALRDLPPA